MKPKRITARMMLDWLLSRPAYDAAYHPRMGRICIVHPKSIPVYCNGDATKAQTMKALKWAMRRRDEGFVDYEKRI